MKLSMYSVLDAKTGAFCNPFVDHGDQSALRGFSDMVNDASVKGNQWYSHPEDFALYQLADFFTDTGEIRPVDKLRCLATAVSVKRSAELFEEPLLGKNVKEGKVINI